MSELANTGGTLGYQGMDYVWTEDVEALREEQGALLAQLDGMLSLHLNKGFLEPYLRQLFNWLWQRVAREEADLDPGFDTTRIRVRGDDLLEGLCITACMNTEGGYMTEPMEAYFLAQVRPMWNIIANRLAQPVRVALTSPDRAEEA